MTTHERALASEIAGAKPGSVDHETRYCLFDTAIGSCGVAWGARGLTRLQLPEADRGATERRLRARAAKVSEAPPAEIDRLIAEVQCYMTGCRVDFAAVEIDLANIDPFERKIYAAARTIPWGQTLTYGELARQIGSPDAARAVGRALGRNPVPIVVPCHRILAKGHRIGGFSAPGGTFTKERLLALEGVRIEAGTPLLPGLFETDR
jgi:methylated-DNA-[protein]-cysteine S-methyltransferase